MPHSKSWPWTPEQAPSEGDYVAWIRARYPNTDPIWVIPLDNINVESAVITQGVLYILAESYLHGESTPFNIYIDGTLAIENRENLLPDWANFIGGDIHIDYDPTLGNLKDFIDDYALAITDSLNFVMLRELKELEEDSWIRILQTRPEEVREAAVRNEEIARMVIEKLTFISNNGEITLNEDVVLDVDGKRILPITEQISPQRKIYEELFCPYGVVVHARDEKDRILLSQYARRQGAVELRIDHDGNAFLFEPVDFEEDDRWSNLAQKSNHSPLVSKVSIARFKLIDVPAVLMPPNRDATLLSNILDRTVSKNMREAYSMLWLARPNPKDWTLILNGDNTLITRLQSLENTTLGLSLALRELFHVSYLFTTDDLEPEMQQIAWKDTIELIERICELEDKKQELEQDVRKLLKEKDEMERKKEAIEKQLNEEIKKYKEQFSIAERYAIQISISRNQIEKELDQKHQALLDKEEELAKVRLELEKLHTSEVRARHTTESEPPVDPYRPVEHYALK